MKRSSVGLVLVLLAFAFGIPTDALLNDDPVERAALMALYKSTDGPNWYDNYLWGNG